MTKRQLRDVHPGQVWRDRDTRMNRLVRVKRCELNGDGAFVYYQTATPAGQAIEIARVHKSRYDRFQRAFDYVRD